MLVSTVAFSLPDVLKVVPHFREQLFSCRASNLIAANLERGGIGHVNVNMPTDIPTKPLPRQTLSHPALRRVRQRATRHEGVSNKDESAWQVAKHYLNPCSGGECSGPKALDLSQAVT